MSTADIQARDGHVQNRTGRRRARRGFSVDMTPLVDVAFLLLTFFMCATTMARPQAMEIQLPPGLSWVDVRQSLLLDLYALGDGRIFARQWSTGELRRVDRDQARRVIADHYRTSGAIVAIKVDTAARYQRLVDLLDDVRRASRMAGDDGDDDGTRYSVQRMTADDYREVAP